MSITDLGLGTDSSTSSSNGYRVYERDDPSVGSAGHPIRLVWSTELGSDVQDTFTFAVRWRAWHKGRAIQTGWSSYYRATVDAAKCNERRPRPGGRVWWSHGLDIAGLMADIAGSSWRYDTRKYDSIDLQASVYSTFTKSFAESYGQTKSNTASATLHVGHIPDYALTSVYYDEPDLVVVEYKTTWTRQDDRYCIESDSRVVGGRGTSALASGKVWGTVAAPGRIELPTSDLTQHVKGKSVYLNIRFNAAYRPCDLDFSNARGTVAVEDRSLCNTPTLAIARTGDPYAVAVKTGDSGDLGVPIKTVTVKLADGRYAADETTVAAGDTAVVRFPPLNRPILIEAVGGAGKRTSAAAEIEADAIATHGITVIDSIGEEGSRVVLEWNQAFDISAEPARELVQIAGRRRQAAYYGEGGATQVSVTADLIDDDGAAIERLCEQGDAMVRIHDGRRYAVSPDVKVSWSGPNVRSVTFGGGEVDA